MPATVCSCTGANLAPEDEPFAWARVVQVDAGSGRTLTLRVSCDSVERCSFADRVFDSIAIAQHRLRARRKPTDVPSAAAALLGRVIVSMHVATGAAAGILLGSRRRALLAGPLLHLLCDVVPHEDVDSLRFEIGSGVALLAVVAASRGPLDPAVLGAVASCAPDVEHVVRLRRAGGRKLFPTHRFRGLHPPGGVPAWVQLVVAGAIVGATIGGRRSRTS